MSVDVLLGYFIGVIVSIAIGLCLSKTRLKALHNWLVVVWIGSACAAFLAFVILRTILL